MYKNVFWSKEDHLRTREKVWNLNNKKPNNWQKFDKNSVLNDFKWSRLCCMKI